MGILGGGPAQLADEVLDVVDRGAGLQLLLDPAGDLLLSPGSALQEFVPETFGQGCPFFRGGVVLVVLWGMVVGEGSPPTPTAGRPPSRSDGTTPDGTVSATLASAAATAAPSRHEQGSRGAVRGQGGGVADQVRHDHGEKSHGEYGAELWTPIGVRCEDLEEVGR